MGQVAGKVTRAQYLGDIRAVADHAKQQSWARADRLGVTGFCGGGALTLHFTAEYPGVTAAVPWYGHVKRTYADAPGVDAFSLVDWIKVPVLGLYGEADSGIAADDVRRFERELKKRNPHAEFVLYPGGAPRVLLVRPAPGLSQGSGGRRLEALPRLLRQAPRGVEPERGGATLLDHESPNGSRRVTPPPFLSLPSPLLCVSE